ncbi:ubiquitin carboxyl-terminal hydrolase 10 [Corvus cornix cornix]|uniref:Ubiquitin carboxyl-terminal hydrolase n=2 Tax=Corvus moneduloides TaxID=1196302 RepID=A0A8C3DXR4_CORMO|nr:ubiquitin carboxyl-terminal hydrolase 10 [Corvus moneduloides]XP_039414164.1 ubiquitin carboxyl-terminal hydrolase 10 [Corvus cornix cornix]XP_048172522.1 ubiquitin carboxyl-terminal hydrolase 10 [Corvus hawaiiensis]
MALHGAQYIFGEFSPDEFNQFFVTPRCSVELPPYNETVSCGIKSTGEEYQRIEFGVNEVIETQSSVLNNTDYSISSTLNPQAPEFILSCAPAQKTPDDALSDTNYNSIDCQFSDPTLALDSGSNAENDSLAGGLGQRERKKKKKRPPGYYSYLEDVPDGVAAPEALVNGHATAAGLNSLSTEDTELAGDLPSLATPRTCSSPASSVDFLAGAACAEPGAAAPGRTAGQPEVCRLPNSEQFCLPSEAIRDSPLRTAVVQSYAGTDTTETLGVTNGQTLESSGEDTAANGVELHTVESTDSDQAKPEEASPTTEATVPLAGSVPVNQPAKSWASLFHNSKPSASTSVVYVETKYTPPATSPLVPEKQVEVKEGPVPVSEDPVAIKIAEILENVRLIHKPVSLQPRGLINKGNWCYINATLQALVACPPMYHLMKSIPMYSKSQRPCTSTPMLDSFVRLMNEFTNMPVPPKAKQALGDKIVRDIRPGAAFEPTYIYRLLTVIKSSLSEKGRQEDAEEYLGFILNGLHEEMLTLKKLLSPHNEKLSVSNGPEAQSVPKEEEQEEQGEGSEDEWEQVGPRNKSSVTRQADFVQTPITDIFGGHIRSVVYQQSSKESATLQLFFTLQLDIQSDKIRTVQDALESLVARESVQGYTTKTKQEVEISRRLTLEKLPPVLVLHLKRFVYEKTGGCQKLIKNIEYTVDLEISKELLSPGVKSKISKGQRTYRLFAVVYHHGNSATGGHYTTDVFQIGLNGWLRIDDQAVRVIHHSQVVKAALERTAYLLYYRQVDLL